LSQRTNVHSGRLGLGEDSVARFLLFADMQFDVLAEHLDFSVVKTGVRRTVQEFPDENLGSVVLDLRFVEHVVLDTLFATGRIEQLFLELGMHDQLLAHLLCQACFLFGGTRRLVLAEQTFDGAMVLLEQRYRV
jgi:hypothetical protein